MARTTPQHMTDDRSLNFDPISKKDLALERGESIDLRNNTWRVFHIISEMVEGYQFLSRFHKQVTVFGSARTKANSLYYKLAEEIGAKLGKAGYSVITGGGPGIMEAANKGAFEAGGMSIGLNIQLPREQRTNPYVRESCSFSYFLTRKIMLATPSLGFVVMPGGFGTLDEMFEVAELIGENRLARAPVILCDHDFWNPLVKFLRANAAGKINALHEKDLEFIHVVDTADEVLALLNQHVEPADLNTCPLGIDKFTGDDTVNWRVFRVMAELVEGFDFLRDVGEVVTVIGTPHVRLDSKYYQAAYEMGKMIGQKKIGVLTGGTGGIMEAANKGAFEIGANSYGLPLADKTGAVANNYANKSHAFHFPFTRKLMLTTPSRGFLMFPGGYGTLNMCFEILTLIQTQKIKPIPVVLFGRDYWEPLLKFIKEKELEKEQTISAHDLDYCIVVDTPAEAMKALGF